MPANTDGYVQDMFERVNKRLRAIEEQLALLSEKAGIPYTMPGAGVSPEVIALVREGKTLEAIKKYRELTGADFATANEVVTGL